MKFTNVFFLICFPLLSFSQQEPQFTMFWNNYSVYNPAASGIKYKYYSSIVSRDQWVGLEGAPITTSCLFDMKSNRLHGGVGISYIYDKIGIYVENKLNLNYSFKQVFEDYGTLFSGMSISTNTIKTDFSKIIANNTNDTLLYLLNNKKQTKFDQNMGFLFIAKKWQIGMSVTQLNESVFSKIHYTNKRNYFIYGLFEFQIFDDLELKPGILFKIDNVSYQIDMNLLALLKERYWCGIIWRKTDAIAFMAGIDIKGRFRIGYSYDYTTSALKKVSNGSHEIVLALMLE